MKKIIIILIAITLIAATVFVHHRHESNENARMESFARLIADETDVEFEKTAVIFIDNIKNDQNINSWFGSVIPSDDSIASYISDKHFNDIALLDSYTVTITVCDENTYLKLDDDETEIPCNLLFFNILQINDKTILSDNLIHIDDPTTDVYYLVTIDYPHNHTLYIEFYKEKIFNELATENLKNYSFSIYKNNILEYKYGNYLYPNNLKNFIAQDDGIHKGKKFKHYICNVSVSKTVVVTIEFERWMRFVAPFSIIFLALLLAYFLYIYLVKGHSVFKQSFHSKMQITILLTLAFSFFIVGLVSFIFLKNNVTKKTEINQYKQANIIRNRLESNITKENILTNKSYLNTLAETFLCDINIYDLDGNLINTTIKDFMENTDNQPISDEAYRDIVVDGAGYFMQTEYYGDEKCSAYYFPILDKNNELAAILNVPYFESNSDYDDRISNFVLNYINIIIVLLGISSIVVILITRKTLKPLKIIEDQMGKISLDGTNEPIDFKGRDEIAALVEQYNKMCRQLEIAANRLARNERENAWREMARQVAHEIKNPLTPMRLNIEYLQMLWDRKDPNFDKNLKETLDSLLEQIETLSKIATAFSDYAKLPENTASEFDLAELLKNTVNLYNVEKNISITLIYNAEQSWTLYADKNNLSRVFGNIIKNGIQAIGNTKAGHIEVILSRLGERYKVKISDNGCGIKDEDKGKVFFPNFTTKSSGMGVGLSVSQDIVQAMGGNISFSSQEGIGTVFTIDLPILKEK